MNGSGSGSEAELGRGVPRGPHDLGGTPAGPVSPSEHDHLLWEKRVDALAVLLDNKGLVGVDEMRRAIEGLGAEAYHRMRYYERWIATLTTVLIEKGVITVDELGRRMAEVRAHAAEKAKP
jgi:hypothetical protein